jgi:hypothetical protein
MILAIDFDGVIHDKAHPQPGKRMGFPIEGTKETMDLLREEGAYIIIFSVWANGDLNQRAIETWLNYFEIPYDYITNVKPKADYYIDDRAIRFTNWKDVYDQINL